LVAELKNPLWVSGFFAEKLYQLGSSGSRIQLRPQVQNIPAA